MFENSNCFRYVQLINVLISVAVFFSINVNVAQVFERQKPVASALISFTSSGKEAGKAFLSGALPQWSSTDIQWLGNHIPRNDKCTFLVFEAEFYSTGFPVDFRHQKRKKND